MTLVLAPAPLPGPASPPPSVTPDPNTGTVEQRAELARGLIALATLVMTNPHVPIVSFGAVHKEFTYWARGTAAQMRAEVDRVAAIIGQPAALTRDGTRYETSREFGLVSYRAVALLTCAEPAVAA